MTIPSLGYFKGFGIVTTVSTVQGALRALTARSDALGYKLKIEKSKLVGVTVFFAILDLLREAHLSISPDRVKKSPDHFGAIPERKAAFSARTRKLAGKLNFARTTVM